MLQRKAAMVANHPITMPIHKRINCLGIALVFCLSTTLVRAADHEPELPLDELRLFSAVFHQIQQRYLHETTDATLLESAIRGMLDGLDPHSAYLNAPERRELNIDAKGQFGGIGVEIEWRDNTVVVIAPIDDTPAARAGIKSGDRIITIDDRPTHQQNFQHSSEQLRGSIGSTVQLTVQRQGVDQLLRFELQRAIVKVHSVRHQWPLPGYLYLRISRFQEETATELLKILQSQLDGAATTHGLVLDLRDNPGGLMAAAVAVADIFLNGGDIVSTRGRNERPLEKFSAQRGDLSRGLPIVVLLNNGSASAAEVLAGALQDRQRAVLVGTRSFGKGSVQSIIPLPKAQALKLTTALYFTPNGHSIRATGIEPDIVVEYGQWQLPPLKLNTRENNLPGHLPPPTVPATAAQQQAATPIDRKVTKDSQLHAALLLLQGMGWTQAQAASTSSAPAH